MAIRHLVCGACFSTSRLPIPVIQTILLQDTYIVLLLARLVFRIGSVHNVLLSTLLSVFVISRPSPGPSALPITRSQLYRVITNRSSRTSVASLLPTPKPTEILARHAFVDLVEAVGHALAMQPANTVVVDKYQRLMDSVQGRRCICDAQSHFVGEPVSQIPQLVCCLTFWFDGWDPNSSMTKANKTPIWSGTVTLIFATLQGKVIFAITQLVASGPGKADHTEVVQCLLDSIVSMKKLSLTRSFWVRLLEARALVFPSVVVITCDQPERQTIYGLLAGNSKLHACFGISCNTALLIKPL
jgi:hypothetical protein